jgi:hypothetical protein
MKEHFVKISVKIAILYISVVANIRIKICFHLIFGLFAVLTAISAFEFEELKIRTLI